MGRSNAIAALLREVSLVAPLDVNVLLTGASGTGKTQVARVIHDSGSRAGRAMVEVNCAALPEPLLESELFGARAGAHSTASSHVPGKVAAAEGGTLLLDEIGELPLSAQAELLRRTLEETDWNVSESARRLDVARSHIYRLIGAFGIERRGA